MVKRAGLPLLPGPLARQLLAHHEDVREVYVGVRLLDVGLRLRSQQVINVSKLSLLMAARKVFPQPSVNSIDTGTSFLI